MPSVIIPAHNEESVIGRLLEAITVGSGRDCDRDDLEIWVVCNGCTDATAERARSFGDGVHVIETGVASKSEALRLGDRAANVFPRFYVDADVVISRGAVDRVSRVLAEGKCLAAAPRLRVDLTRSPWTVRAYYQIWLSLPYHLDGMIGSGVYAMSREGRARFDEFPDIISDDGFARLQFAPDERRTVPDVDFTITPPTSLKGIVNVKKRSQKGLFQLHRRFPELLKNDPRGYSSSLSRILRDPRNWAASLVYLYVILRTKLAAAWLNYRGDLGTWERDDTSRAMK